MADITNSASTTDAQANEQPTVDELRQLYAAEKTAREKLEGDVRSLRGRLRTQSASAEAITESEERMSRVMKQALKDAMSEDDPDERQRRIDRVYADADRERTRASQVTQTQPRLQKIVDDFNDIREKDGLDPVDWDSDPMFEEARDAWTRGATSEAMSSARTAVLEARLEMRSAGQYTEEEMKAERERAERNGSRDRARVDTGGSTASSGGGELDNVKTIEELRAVMRQNPNLPMDDFRKKTEELTGRSIRSR